MKVRIELPEVEACHVRECAYNGDGDCFAPAITIGDGLHPACDTYFRADRHRAHHPQPAGVGACKVSSCEYNDDFTCQASSIRVDYVEGKPDCLTYSPTG